MKLQAKILLTLIIAIAGTGYFIWSTYQDHQRSTAAQHWVNHTHDIINAIDDTYTLLAETESAVRGHAITRDTVFLAGLNEKIFTIHSLSNHLLKLVKDNPEQLERVKRLQLIIDQKLQLQQEILAAENRSDTAALNIISSLRGKMLMDSVKTVWSGIKSAEGRLLNERISSNETVSASVLKTGLIAGMISLIFTVVILLLLNRDMLLRKKADRKLAESENKYRELIENSGVVMFTSDLKGDFKFVNQQGEELTGYTAAELMSLNFATLVHPEHLDRVRNAYMDQVKEQQRNSVIEFPIITRHGIKRWVEQSCTMQMKDGVPTGLQCFVKDITQQRVIELELQKAEAQRREYQYRIQAILDNTPLMIYIKDLQGNYTLVNKRFKETFSVTDEMVLGKDVLALTGMKTLSDSYNDADKKVLETGEPIEVEETIEFNGNTHHLLLIKFPLFNDEKEIFGIGGVVKDITDMVNFRHQLISARKKAEQAEKLQEQFLANMSHEIRTPMNGIIGMANLLSETPLTQEQKEFLKIVQVSSNTLLVLINDILDLSKIKAGKLNIEAVDFNLHEIVRHASGLISHKAQQKNIAVDVMIHPNVPKRIKGDPLRLEQVLSNLLSNAVKFTNHGFIRVEVELIDSDEQDPVIRFTVRDTGIGIPAHKLDSIFDSFTQAENDTSRRFGGTGLGLAITKNLIELQGGSLSVDSSPGLGSAFRVDLPLTEVQDVQPTENKQVEHSGCVKLRGKKILVAEDNEINQKVIYHHLSRLEIDVTIAENGRLAVSELEKGSAFDLIIMDLQMPEMNGLQATTYIRQKLKSKIPIVAMTASVLRDERKLCLELGMNDYLAKPFSPEDLLDVLKRFLVNEEEHDNTPQTEAKPKIQTSYDLSFLREAGEEAFVTEVLDMFMQNTPQALDEINEEVLHEHWESVGQKAHKLKSSVGMLQANGMMEKLVLLEKKAKEKPEVEHMLLLVAKLDEEFSLLKPMLEAEKGVSSS